MSNWEKELAPYIEELEKLFSAVKVDLELPPEIPELPTSEPLPATAPIAYRAYSFYRTGCVIRARELLESILTLSKKGLIPSVAPLVRLAYEIWGVSHILTAALQDIHRFLSEPITKNLAPQLEGKLRKVDRVFEGVRTPVLLPWGTSAAETPIHILDAIRGLSDLTHTSLEDYEFLCEAAHPNFPRYMEWYIAGKIGDNWSNKVAAERCGSLIERTISLLKQSINGIKTESELGVKVCIELFQIK